MVYPISVLKAHVQSNIIAPCGTIKKHMRGAPAAADGHRPIVLLLAHVFATLRQIFASPTAVLHVESCHIAEVKSQISMEVTLAVYMDL